MMVSRGHLAVHWTMDKLLIDANKEMDFAVTISLRQLATTVYNKICA